MKLSIEVNSDGEGGLWVEAQLIPSDERTDLLYSARVDGDAESAIVKAYRSLMADLVR